jgi:DNA-binding MarR family transcriptional regulator
LAYPIITSYFFWVYGDTKEDGQLFASILLFIGTLIAAYASLELLNFQKISLGKTKKTVHALGIFGIVMPFLTGILYGNIHWFLIAYNLSVTAMVLIFLAIGKLTQNYIPRYRLLAYSSARLGSIFLLVDPMLTNYVYLAGVTLFMKHALRLVGAVSQCFAILLLSFTVVMLILEAQTRGVHLIPTREKKDKKPMKYRLKKGYSYLLQEQTGDRSMEIFLEYVKHQHFGLLLTRTQPSRVRQTFGLQTTPILWMTNADTDEKAVKPKDLERMLYVIKDFISFERDSVLLIQRLDYLITENDFSLVLRFVHQLNDLITTHRCVLVVSLDPSTLKNEKLSLLLQELEDITHADNISLGEPLYSVLLYVHGENSRRKTPSFKSITSKFLITKTTARKRIYELESKGLLKILTQGRYKYLEVTDKGRVVVASPVGPQGGENEES